MEYILIRVLTISVESTYELDINDVEVHYIAHGKLDYILDCIRKMLYHVHRDSDDEHLGTIIRIEDGNLVCDKFVRLREFLRSRDHTTYYDYDYIVAPINNHAMHIS